MSWPATNNQVILGSDGNNTYMGLGHFFVGRSHRDPSYFDALGHGEFGVYKINKKDAATLKDSVQVTTVGRFTDEAKALAAWMMIAC